MRRLNRDLVYLCWWDTDAGVWLMKSWDQKDAAHVPLEYVYVAADCIDHVAAGNDAAALARLRDEIG